MSAKPQLRARLVLSDANEATQRLQQRFQEGGNWRVEWVAVVTLLRAVDHVLRLVDNQDPPAKAAILAAWERWKLKPARDAIFWEFILEERNNVIKEYVIGEAAPSYLLMEDGGRLALEDSSGFLILEQPNIERVYEALAWWEEELSAIEDAMLPASSPARGQ